MFSLSDPDMTTIPVFLRPSFWRLYRAMSASVVEAFCFSHPVLNAILHILCAPFRAGTDAAGYQNGIHDRAGRPYAERQSLAGRDRGARHAGPRAPRMCLQPARSCFLGNHAGLGDAFALLSASPRRDTQILANNFGILPGLQEMHRHVIVVDKSAPYLAMRQSLRHLRLGKSLLIYPRGEIEDDPALDLEPAQASLSEWSRSIELFARHVPDLTVMPCAVGGVISRRALRNPVVRQYQRQRQTALSGGDLPDAVPILSRSGHQPSFWSPVARRIRRTPDRACANGGTAPQRQRRAARFDKLSTIRCIWSSGFRTYLTYPLRTYGEGILFCVSAADLFAAAERLYL